MFVEPKYNRVPGPSAKNNGRWRWYYPAIADWMLSHPGGTQKECAEFLGKNTSTIGFITNSDMFQEYYRKRREEYRRHHDEVILGKTTRVAEAALDLMLEKMEKQGDKIPMQLITEVATSALDRLGYAPKRESVSVNVDNRDQRQQVNVSVSLSALEEAKDALRVAESQRAITQREVVDASVASEDTD